MDVLGRDLRERLDAVATLQRLHGEGMGEDRRFEQRLRLGKTLDVVDIGVGRDEGLAGREGEVHLPDHLHDLFHVLGEADVDQHPLPVVIDQIDVAADPPPGLVVHLDDTGEQGAALEHRQSGRRRTGGGQGEGRAG